MKSLFKHLAEIDETYYIERYNFKNSKARGHYRTFKGNRPNDLVQKMNSIRRRGGIIDYA